MLAGLVAGFLVASKSTRRPEPVLSGHSRSRGGASVGVDYRAN